MKVITAIIRPDKLDGVQQAVIGAGARGITVTDVRGFGQQFGHRAGARPDDREIVALPKTRIDVVVQDELTGPVTDVIAKAAHTGIIRDGKIWVCPVDGALRVRTGEHGTDAV